MRNATRYRPVRMRAAQDAEPGVLHGEATVFDAPYGIGPKTTETITRETFATSLGAHNVVPVFWGHGWAKTNAYMLWRANGDSASPYSGIGLYATNNPGSGVVNTLGAVGFLTHQPLAANLVHVSWLNDDPSQYRPCLWSAMQTRVVGVVTYWSSGGSDWQSTGQPIDTIDLYMASGTFTNGSWFRMEGRR